MKLIYGNLIKIVCRVKDEQMTPEDIGDSSNANLIYKFVPFGSGRINQLATYGLLFGSLIIFSVIRTTYYFTYCVSASERLHKKLLDSILSAPMSYFNENTIGMTNRLFKLKKENY